ncbi:GNAT family N-acetyltransferase [Vibrio sp. 10N]|uniref:GNAT family N-acetyltransferase n=1 Tax=Vibrio sp. 10N TaxID=3058938 RepID=UPI0028129ED3|nr:GNAT family N-acetyltransferase [Vibrio sp. 10N]
MFREMTRDDFDAFWPTFSKNIEGQETYAFEPNMSLEQSFDVWCNLPLKTFVYVKDREILGSFYIKANATGPSRHICNCGYMVSERARGKGIACLMCEYSQQIAIELGFEAMQFNSVVSTNTTAVALWQSLGFDIVGTIPRAYNHSRLGYVDSFVMYKGLVGE